FNGRVTGGVVVVKIKPQVVGVAGADVKPIRGVVGGSEIASDADEAAGQNLQHVRRSQRRRHVEDKAIAVGVIDAKAPVGGVGQQPHIGIARGVVDGNFQRRTFR